MDVYKIIADQDKVNEFIDWLPRLEENEMFYTSLFARSKYHDSVSAIYITPNPRNMEKAAIATAHKLIDLVSSPYSGYNPHQICLNEIQKMKSKTRFVIFDFDIDKDIYDPALNIGYDNKLEEINRLIESIEKIIPEKCMSYIETRGGLHVLVKVDEKPDTYNKMWYNDFKIIKGLDQSGDQMIPIVGTYQGGFVPRFIKI
ncbi:MAG: hypothetical protein LBU84_07665 [Prevotella sp.]|jgi:hypothetical protein|nr:hypothetical protein [Prevotella sp.]